MGQTFKLLAPHARLTEEFGGKLQEIFGGGTAQHLVRLLAIPVLPKIAVNPDRTTSQTASPSNRSPAQNECGEASVAVAVKRKASAEFPKSPPRLQKKTRTASRSHLPSSQPATFSELPTELHHLIFSHVQEVQDVLSLGLVNRRLCDIARGKLLARFSSLFAPWAGEKIVCVGEDTDPNDYPPGLFSDAELEAISKEEIEVYDEGEEEYITITPRSLVDFTRPGVSVIQEEFDTKFEVLGIGLLLSEPLAPEEAALRYLGLREFIECDQYLPKDQPWILRNLTTKQFVRAEAIALKEELIFGPNIDIIGFGHVLLLRICWSSSSVFGLHPSIVRGIWAGHCFDITVLAKHQEETGNGEGWTDISDEVAKEIATFCEADLGTDWRSILINGSRRTIY